MELLTSSVACFAFSITLRFFPFRALLPSSSIYAHRLYLTLSSCLVNFVNFDACDVQHSVDALHGDPREILLISIFKPLSLLKPLTIFNFNFKITSNPATLAFRVCLFLEQCINSLWLLKVFLTCSGVYWYWSHAQEVWEAKHPKLKDVDKSAATSLEDFCDLLCAFECQNMSDMFAIWVLLPVLPLVNGILLITIDSIWC